MPKISNLEKSVKNTVTKAKNFLPDIQLQHKPPFQGKIKTSSRPKAFRNYIPAQYVEVDKQVGIFSFVEARVQRQPDDELFNYKISEGHWRSVSAKEFKKEVFQIAKGLIAKGLKKNDSFAIMGPTSYEWILFDYACALLGIISVPIYETSSVKQIAYILEDANVKMAAVQNQDMLHKFTDLRPQFPHLQEVLVFEENAVNELRALGASISDQNVNQFVKEVNGDTLLTIVYTSGSVGVPKGVELTHYALMSIAANTSPTLPELLLAPGARYLLFLPLAHIFARFSCLAVLNSPSTIGVTGSIATLLDDLRHLKPTYTIAVPRVMEKIVNAASQKAGGGIKGKIFQRALQTAIEYSQALDTDEGVSRTLETKRVLYDRLVYSQIRQVMGGQLKHIVSGGAPLSSNLSHFFRTAGIPVLEGYGLTETAAPTFVSRVHANAIGTIGYPFPNVEYKISPSDNELILKCASLFRGYHNDPVATKQVLKNGWLYTGDLARDNGDGTITLIGRSKDLIVTAGGKNVSPSFLENALRDNSLISNAVLVGDRKPFISALITLDPDSFKLWAKKNGLTKLTLHDAVENPAVISAVQRMVDQANLLVSRAESIRKFIIVPQDFSVENGLLTPSLKLKRQAVYDYYADLINYRIYNR